MRRRICEYASAAGVPSRIWSPCCAFVEKRRRPQAHQHFRWVLAFAPGRPATNKQTNHKNVPTTHSLCMRACARAMTNNNIIMLPIIYKYLLPSLECDFKVKTHWHWLHTRTIAKHARQFCVQPHSTASIRSAYWRRCVWLCCSTTSIWRAYFCHWRLREAARTTAQAKPSTAFAPSNWPNKPKTLIWWNCCGPSITSICIAMHRTRMSLAERRIWQRTCDIYVYIERRLIASQAADRCILSSPLCSLSLSLQKFTDMHILILTQTMNNTESIAFIMDASESLEIHFVCNHFDIACAHMCVCVTWHFQ